LVNRLIKRFVITAFCQGKVSFASVAPLDSVRHYITVLLDIATKLAVNGADDHKREGSN